MLWEIVIVVEATVQPGRESLTVKNHGPDEGCRVITLFTKDFRPCGMFGRKRYGKISDSVRAGQEPGKNCGVRSIGNRARSKGLREAYALLCQCIQGRGFHVLIAVAVNVVRAQSVDGDKEDVRVRVLFG
jgi:hypothetical protein